MGDVEVEFGIVGEDDGRSWREGVVDDSGVRDTLGVTVEFINRQNSKMEKKGKNRKKGRMGKREDCKGEGRAEKSGMEAEGRRTKREGRTYLYAAAIFATRSASAAAALAKSPGMKKFSIAASAIVWVTFA